MATHNDLSRKSRGKQLIKTWLTSDCIIILEKYYKKKIFENQRPDAAQNKQTNLNKINNHKY